MIYKNMFNVRGEREGKKGVIVCVYECVCVCVCLCVWVTDNGGREETGI